MPWLCPVSHVTRLSGDDRRELLSSRVDPAGYRTLVMVVLLRIVDRTSHDSRPARFGKRDFSAIGGIDHAQVIRHLANRIKHHESSIVAGTSQDADACMTQCGFPDGMRIGDWSRRSNHRGPIPCPYFNLHRIQCFCSAAVNAHCGVPFPIHAWAESEVEERQVRQWLGDFLDLEARNEMTDE